MRVAVLVSGGGSNLQALIDEGFDIKLVISDQKNARALERAENSKIANYYIGKHNFEQISDRNAKMLCLFKQFDIDIIVLAGYLSILHSDIISAYENKIINIHPSLIPSFCGKGFYGMNVHNAVYNSGVKITGATVHFVNTGIDTGAIILQDVVEISDDDTAQSIQKKVIKIEHKLLPKALKLIEDKKIKICGNRTYIGG